MSLLPIAYGTYGMPEIDFEKALPRLADIGYEGVELCVAADWPTAPGKMNTARRRHLRNMVADLGLQLPALMILSKMLSRDQDEYAHATQEFHQACRLAADLSLGGRTPVVTTTPGGGLGWQEDREQIAERAMQWAEVAATCGTVFALEPHIGGPLEDPQRAVWLLARAPSPYLRLNFDISHFAVADYDLVETIRLLAPLAIHTHVKDGRRRSGKVEFLLPGEGTTDYVTYFREMGRLGFALPITVEVSGMIFRAAGYDPWAAAGASLTALSRAREQAAQELGGS